MDASSAEGLKWRSFFTVWLTTGAHHGELKALRWTDLNLDAGAVSIQQNGQRAQGVGRFIGQPKKAGSRRPVALSSDVIAHLQKQRNEP